jgi:hypothetical protein
LASGPEVAFFTFKSRISSRDSALIGCVQIDAQASPSYKAWSWRVVGDPTQLPSHPTPEQIAQVLRVDQIYAGGESAPATSLDSCDCNRCWFGCVIAGCPPAVIGCIGTGPADPGCALVFCGAVTAACYLSCVYQGCC